MKSRYVLIALSTLVAVVLVVWSVQTGRDERKGSKVSAATTTPVQATSASRPGNSRQEVLEAFDRACRLAQQDRKQEKLEYYEQFIEKYPFTPLTPRMMSRLAMGYAKKGEYDRARGLLEAAQELLGSDPFRNTIDVNLAQVFMMQGDLRASEKVLTGVMQRTPNDASALSEFGGATLFLAPLTLAECYGREARFNEADVLLGDVATAANTLLREHPDKAWVASYAADAYYRRVELVLKRQPADLDRARQLADEMKQRMPNYSGARGYPDLLRVINAAQAVQAKEKRAKEKPVKID
jgi:tetratricopeptide (TPR) repeat protein